MLFILMMCSRAFLKNYLIQSDHPAHVVSDHVDLQLIVSVVSARDWVTLTCTSWRGNDDRMTQNMALDVNPLLTYSVVQRTEGAVVYEELILQTSDYLYEQLLD